MSHDFLLRGETIDLFQLLKASGLCDSGGEAKQMIEHGLVRVDGVVETRKACKIRAGRVVTYSGRSVTVKAGG